MSFHAIKWAAEQKLPAMQKIVLLMLANRTNPDTGLCYPSHDKLAIDCGMTKRSVIQQIEKLEKCNFLTVLRETKDSVKQVNKYRLHISSEPHSLGVVNDVHYPSEPHSLGVVNDVHIKQSIETVIETVNRNSNITTTTTEKKPKEKKRGGGDFLNLEKTKSSELIFPKEQLEASIRTDEIKKSSIRPPMTETVIVGDRNSHSIVTETVTSPLTVSVSTKKKPPLLRNTNLTAQKIEGENASGGGDFLDSKNAVSSVLIFPKKLTLKEQLEAEKLLLKCDGQAQEILDALEASIRAGEIKKSPLALLGGMVRRYKAGAFDPTPGMHIAIERQKIQAGKQAVEAIISHEAVMQKLNAMDSGVKATADSAMVEKLKILQKKRAQNKNSVSLQVDT